MRLFLGLAFSISLIASADASCVCRCVDGEMQPLCESSIDLPPICAPTVCALAPPAIAPIRPPVLPPFGASRCSRRQVMIPATGQYEWRTICN